MMCLKLFCDIGHWFQNDREAEEAALQAIYARVNKLMELWPCTTGNGYDIP